MVRGRLASLYDTFYGIVRYSADSLVHLLAPSCGWCFPSDSHIGSGFADVQAGRQARTVVSLFIVLA